MAEKLITWAVVMIVAVVAVLVWNEVRA